MNWISDVKDELLGLDQSHKKLRQFGYLMAAVLVIISIWIFIKQGFNNLSLVPFTFAVLFFLAAILRPQVLRVFYKVWMALAFAMGWIFSRVLLILVFFLVLSPIALIAKLFGKRWMDLKFNEKKDSYWIEKANIKIDYEKLY